MFANVTVLACAVAGPAGGRAAALVVIAGRWWLVISAA